MNIKNIEQNRDLLIESLIAEEQELIKKIEKSRKDDDYGLYKNLIRALTDVTSLKQRELANLPKETWKDMFSHYKMKIDDEFKEVVSTWRQKGEDIKDHKIYKIEKEIKENPTYKLYYDIGRIDKNSKCIIFFKDKMTTIVGDYKYIATYISSLCYNENVEIHGDINGLGLGLADELKSIGYIVKPTTLTVFDISKNIGGREIKQDYSKLREL